MKKILAKQFILLFVATAMTVSTAFAGVNQQYLPQQQLQQQQIEQIRLQNEQLSQQNEYLKQQTEILRQQTDSLRQNQSYTQGYVDAQRYGYGRRNNNYQLYTGMGVGYLIGHWGGCGCVHGYWGHGGCCGHRCWH